MIVLKNSILSAISIVKLIFPVLVVVELLKYFALINYLDFIAQPVMHLFGLPIELGLVWLTGILTGVYGGVAVFFSIISNPQSISVADATVLSGLILIAHALPIESRISHYLGSNFWYVSCFRLIASFLFAGLLALLFNLTHTLQYPISTTSIIGYQSPEYWFEIITMPAIICLQTSVIIIFLHVMINVLKATHLISYLEHLLTPFTKLLQIHRRLSHSLLIGILLGITYGSSLLKQDFNSTNLAQHEKNKVINLLNILHALIEDTILVLLIGANLLYVLIARILFAVLIIQLIEKFWKIKNHRKVIIRK